MKKQRKKRVNLFDRSFEEVRDTLKTGTKKELQYELDHHGDREWKDEQDKLRNTPILHLDDQDHAMPSTRRDFLAHGLVGTTLSVALPTILAPNMANALTCPESGGGGAANPNLPIVVIDGAGGSSMMGDNIIVGQNDPTQFLSNYQSMGVPDNRRPSQQAPIEVFGAGSKMLFHQHSDNNGLGRGIKDGVVNQALLNNVDGTTICCESNDDSGNNELNISQALVQLGITGSLAGAIGSSSSASGGRSRSIMPAASAQSTRVRNSDEASGLVSPGILATALGNNDNQVDRVVRAIASMTEMQSNAIAGKALTQANKDVVSCGAQANIKILGETLDNIYNTAIVQAAFGGGGPQGGTQQAVATGAYLSLTGRVGVSTVQIGGCDYHGRGRANQDAKDREIGEAIGATIAMAAAANSPVVIYLFSDGSTSSNGTLDGNTGMFEARSDNGRYGSLHVIAYSPNGRPIVDKAQLGEVSPNGVVPGATAWAGSPSTAAQVAAVNYLYLAGMESKISQLGGLGFTPASVKAFAAAIKT